MMKKYILSEIQSMYKFWHIVGPKSLNLPHKMLAINLHTISNKHTFSLLVHFHDILNESFSGENKIISL